MQDNILTEPFQNKGDLKVISRTSVMIYHEAKQSAWEIGKALGSSRTSSGSGVQRVGERSPRQRPVDRCQQRRTHLRADQCDGDLTDVFKIQTDLARQIAAGQKASFRRAKERSWSVARRTTTMPIPGMSGPLTSTAIMKTLRS